MLVIFSFGLVLLATILLVVGLMNDSLPFIYLSIVASVAAAVVLFVAFRAARPKPQSKDEQPEPLEDSPVEVAEAAEEREPVAVAAGADAAGGADATATIPAVEPSGDDWLDDDEWDDEEVVDFPIADYDDLTVAEIMPLLPQLYSDELDTVIDRERSGRNRSTIINRLEQLKVSGTDADAAEAEALDDAPGAAVADDDDAYAPAPSAGALGLDDDDDDDDWFPIADYDELSVRQIVPLLPQLEKDELDDVRAREASGHGRKTILAEVDRLVADEEPSPAPAAPAARRVTAKASPPTGGARFPIANYDDLGVRDIRPQLAGLSRGGLEQVLEREQAGAGRSSVIAEIERQLGGAPAPAKNAPAKKKSAPAKKAPTKKSPSRAKGAAKRTARFPIANYDEIGVRDIRPRLARLSQSQLQQVRDREQAGKNRSSILDEIDKRLG